MLRLSFLSTLACVVFGVAAPLRAQQLREVRVSDANGQLDFWMRAVRRPDDNYTNGARVFLAFDGVPGVRTSASVSTELEIGQDMFTPASADSTHPIPGERPYAGWLYLMGTGRVATPTRSDAVSLRVGMTGRPSLAEQIQTAWHAFIRYNRALGWSHQIPFQPGVDLSYRHDAEVFAARAGTTQVLSLVPHAAATLGTVFTGANAGVDARFGYHVTTPWTSARRGASHAVSAYLESGLQGEWVGRNLFLDQGTTRPTLHVDKEPWGAQYTFGGGVRLRAWELTYRAITRTREYRTGRSIEPYSVISVGWRGAW